MSRIGKQIIAIPANTEVSVTSGEVVVKGPLGELRRAFVPSIAVTVADGNVAVTPVETTLETKALWGTYAAHIANMVAGVTTAFEKKLVVDGVGYKYAVEGDTVVMNLGYSHSVKMKIPAGITAKVEKNLMTISGRDKEMVGRFAAEIREWRKPEPYKGKGIRYSDEVVRRKQGKKTA